MTDDSRYRQYIEEGLQASREGQPQLALHAFLQAAREQPASGLPHFLAGSEHAAAGDIVQAERELANAVLLAPAFHLARYQLGLLQFSSERAAAALVTWQPLVALAAHECLGHFVRGFSCLASDGFVEALGHFRQGMGCEDLLPAVAADAQKVIDALERLVTPSGDQGTPSVTHVLLSAYARGLH